MCSSCSHPVLLASCYHESLNKEENSMRVLSKKKTVVLLSPSKPVFLVKLFCFYQITIIDNLQAMATFTDLKHILHLHRVRPKHNLKNNTSTSSNWFNGNLLELKASHLATTMLGHSSKIIQFQTICSQAFGCVMDSSIERHNSGPVTLYWPGLREKWLEYLDMSLERPSPTK